ncbi:hypothetical protein SAMN05878482_11077 [Peribacillus simplex]|uniref:Uncharacterized protein n=1 Tax=Peribacillus simplex TaxID=1478 RepID=A0A9X8RDZ0_9BACI|nr:DUF5677 domain-containing protein [Peribacillus simplex]SIS04185.1 hypothetical protein SAMN05878482_11077 [Peribacillus simplex]
MKGENLSKLSDHKFKKGIIVSPANDSFGDTLKFNSWTKERLPEYLWLGLILNYYGRDKGLKKGESILYHIANINVDITQPKLSMIFSLSKEKQDEIYKIICNFINPSILSPLTILYRGEQHKVFNHYFYDNSQTVEDRISTLRSSVKMFYNHQSNDTTDLRYLSICLPLFKGMVRLSEGVGMTIESIKNYSKTDHEDERMRFYRPSIRSFEVIDMEENDDEFISYFWRELGLCTDCSPLYIDHPEHVYDIQEFFYDTKKVFENITLLNKEKLIEDPKFNVLMGSTCYILKLTGEVINNELKDSILGRLAFRTILEVFIMMKYLIIKEASQDDIFQGYQLYGIGKYKHILLRVRESSIERESHIAVPIVETIVNEPMWEEFVNIDVRFFDQQNIKKKFEEVNEKELYEIYYEYTTNYAHGFWGAIRESSMLICDNPLHKYHTVADFNFYQKLPSVIYDILKILKKHIELLSEVYEFPKWYKVKYKDLVYGK